MGLNLVTKLVAFKIDNLSKSQSFINSVDFHRDSNRFCATYTQNNYLTIHEINRFTGVRVYQNIKTSGYPQHAIFSKEGDYLISVNWVDETIVVYKEGANKLFEDRALAVTHFPEELNNFKPHGIALSSDEEILAMCLGASNEENKGIALFRRNPDFSFTLLDLYQDETVISGIPKGVSFLPESQSIVVTFASLNSAAIYDIDLTEGKVIPHPRQLISGLFRPEDVKFHPSGNACIFSNSKADNISFHLFSKETRLIQDKPYFVLKNSFPDFNFPHGLAFSPDGNYLAVSQFGKVVFDEVGNLDRWAEKRGDSITLYRLSNSTASPKPIDLSPLQLFLYRGASLYGDFLEKTKEFSYSIVRSAYDLTPNSFKAWLVPKMKKYRS